MQPEHRNPIGSYYGQCNKVSLMFTLIQLDSMIVDQHSWANYCDVRVVNNSSAVGCGSCDAPVIFQSSRLLYVLSSPMYVALSMIGLDAQTTAEQLTAIDIYTMHAIRNVS